MSLHSWFLSLNTKPSRFTHITENVKISFLSRLYSISSDVQNHILFFHLWKVSVYRHLHCFYLLATLNVAAMDMSEQILVHVFVSPVFIFYMSLFLYILFLSPFTGCLSIQQTFTVCPLHPRQAWC